MLRIGSVILRKERNSSVDGSYTDNDHSGIILLGRRHCTQTFLTSVLGKEMQWKFSEFSEKVVKKVFREHHTPGAN